MPRFQLTSVPVGDHLTFLGLDRMKRTSRIFNCGKSYVGETKKKVSTRIKEHQKDVFHGRWEKTGASEHAKNCQEGFKWDEARTLAVEDQWHARKIREALFIRSRQREGQIITNRDTGQLKTRQWDPILGKLAKKRQSTND